MFIHEQEEAFSIYICISESSATCYCLVTKVADRHLLKPYWQRHLMAIPFTITYIVYRLTCHLIAIKALISIYNTTGHASLYIMIFCFNIHHTNLYCDVAL